MPEEIPSVNSDVDAVIAVLRERLVAPGLAWGAPPEPLRGGFWAEMWVGDLVGAPPEWPRRVVIRLSPDAGIAVREAAVQSAVSALGFPTPMVRATGAPELGGASRAWTVMDFVSGTPLLAGLDGLAALRRLPKLARELPDQLAGTMASLHALDVGPVRDAVVVADGDGSVGVGGLITHLMGEAQRLNHVELQRVLAVLLRDRPSEDRVAVCHGDLHPFNVLATETGPVLLDWTASRIADPAYDVAFTSMLLSAPPLAARPPLDRVIGAAGRWLARRFQSRYAVHSGVTLSPTTLAWYGDLCATRSLTEAQSWIDSGTVEQHAGHPWLTMAPGLWKQLRSRV